MVNIIIGDCTDHENPDLWYPELPAGRPTISKVSELAYEIKDALAICASCPVNQQCLEEGMKSENLPFGIWGGLLAGERMKKKGLTREDFPRQSSEAQAIDFAIRMEPWVRW
jgi:hypothetical protein